jgi:hypothetical protein
MCCCGYHEYDSDSDLTDLDTADTDSLEDSSQCSEYSSLSEAPREDGAGDHSGETYSNHCLLYICAKWFTNFCFDVLDTQPAAKRARADQGTDTGTAPAEKGFGRRKKTLGLILTMPIDILLEVK